MRVRVPPCASTLRHHNGALKNENKMSVGTEIERKFIIDPRLLPPDLHLRPQKQIEQHYFCSDPVVRLRRVWGMSRGGYFSMDNDTVEYWYTLKGKGLLSRQEAEVPLTREAYLAFMEHTMPYLKKVRYSYFYHGKMWELDKFTLCSMRNLWLAEIELQSESEEVHAPNFCTQEVTHNPAYSNVNLAQISY